MKINLIKSELFKNLPCYIVFIFFFLYEFCSDFDSDELEILARSGDEESDEDFMDEEENNEGRGSNYDDDDDMNGVDEEEEEEEGEDSNEFEDESDELEDIDDKEDIVKNFELSDSDWAQIMHFNKKKYI